MSGEGSSPSPAATAHLFAALDGTTDIRLAHNADSGAEGSGLTAEKETCDDNVHQELIQREERSRTEREKTQIDTAKHEDEERQRTSQESKKPREESDKAMEGECIKVEEARRDSAVSGRVGSLLMESSGKLPEPATCEINSPPRNPEENPLERRHGKFLKISRGGAKIFFNPLKAECYPNIPLRDSTNEIDNVTNSMTQLIDTDKNPSAGLVMKGASTIVLADHSATLTKSLSGSDNLEIANKPHPYVFSAAGKRPPAALTTGRVMKKPKGFVKNTVPAGPYPDSNDGKDAAIDEIENTVAQAGEVADEEVELEVPMMDDSSLCAEVENVLNRMFEVAKQMFAFREYLATENNSNKPLYQWDKYTGYPELHLATVKLEKIARRLETVSDKIHQTLLSRKYVLPWLDRALNISTSTSKSVAFALNTMSVRSATCMDEITNSSLDEASRDTARILITGEIGELLKHSTAATNSVYAAMDLLRTSLHSETQNGADQNAKPREHIKRSSWKYGAILGLSLLSISLTSFGQFGHLLPADGVPASWIPSNRISGMQIPNGYAVVDITSFQTSLHDTVNAVAEMNIVGNKVTSASLKHLEEIQEATGQRVDNIWDSLGPPGSDGRYKFGPYTCKSNEDLARDIQKVRDEVKTQLDRVNHEIAHLDKIYKEIVDLRRHVHRVDLRLTKRIDHLPGVRT